MKFKHIHFIGICGSGMSALATLAIQSKFHISGCDISCNPIVRHLLHTQNISFASMHGSNFCFDTTIDLYVYSSAIKDTIAELEYAKKHSIKVMHRSDFLAFLMKDRHGIAIAGTHGKTTTTSLISHLLIHAKKDPSIVIGGILPTIQSNAQLGKSNYFVAEADESDRSFLKLPAITKIITTIDYEHPETYKSLEDIKATFREFINKEETALVITPVETKMLLDCSTSLHKKVVTYGLSDCADVYATNINLCENHSTFILHAHEFSINIILSIPGLHNVMNALAACALALELLIKPEEIQSALAQFKAPDRRFTIRGKTKTGITIIDDYAHHPTEIKALIATARNYTQNTLTFFFQAHRYKRTQELWDDFITVLKTNDIDQLYITNIYSAGEMEIPHISGSELTAQLKLIRNPDSTFFIAENQIAEIINNKNNPSETIVFVGAGAIYEIGLQLIQK